MTTRALWLLSSLLAGMVILGLFAARGELIALALPLLVYLGVAIFLAPEALRLKATRQLSTDKVTQGSEVMVKVNVRNEGAMLEVLSLCEAASPFVQNMQGETGRLAFLKEGEAIDFQYTLTGWRGRYDFEGIYARALDPFGLFERQALLPARAHILVYPQVVDLKSVPLHPPQTKGFYGPIPSRKSGAGMDFFGVREYHLGDSLRRINWKTSARYTVDLFTNEYEQERIADVGLLLDARLETNLTVRGRRLFEYAVRATASLAEMFLNDGHCLSLLIYGAGVVRVFPGYGKFQRERVLRALAYAVTGSNYALSNLRYLPTRLLPPRCQLVYISPLAPDDLEPLLRFRSQGYEVLVISPDPLHFELQGESDPGRPDIQLATRFARIERALLMSRLRRASIQVVNWQVDQPLSVAIDSLRMKNLLYRQTLRALG